MMDAILAESGPSPGRDAPLPNGSTPDGAAPGQSDDVGRVALNDSAKRSVDDAVVLIEYAAEAGIEMKAEDVAAILVMAADAQANATTRGRLAAFYAALTNVAARLSPVTADTIRACASPTAARSLKRNQFWASILTALIITLSIIAFVDTSFATKLSADVDAENGRAVQLRTMLEHPDTGGCSVLDTVTAQKARQSEDITVLQQFAAGLRDIYGRAIKLNYFVMRIEHDPLELGSPQAGRRDRLQLKPGLINFDAEVVCKISAFEEVRDFAQNILLDNTVAFGAIAAYILPVAYAMLGALAFRLRAFSDTIRKRTYHPSYADSARMMAALIAGAIVSLFNGFNAQVTLSPLALAFLTGYGVEIFFTFLDTIINSFGSRDGSGTVRT